MSCGEVFLSNQNNCDIIINCRVAKAINLRKIVTLMKMIFISCYDGAVQREGEKTTRVF